MKNGILRFSMSPLRNLLVGTAVLGLASTASSATTFTYTEGSATDIVPSFSFTTSLTGAALANLAPGTDITATVSPFTFFPRGLEQDTAGFPLGPFFVTGPSMSPG